MQAIEFISEVTERGELRVPRQVAEKLPHAKKVRVILLFSSEGADEADWPRLTAEQFLSGYAPGDAIYDKGPCKRGWLKRNSDA